MFEQEYRFSGWQRMATQGQITRLLNAEESHERPPPTPSPDAPTLTATPPSHLLHILAEIIQSREITRLDALRPDEDATLGLTGEVPRAGYGAVVLACGLVEGDANPGAETAGDRGDGADVAYEAAAGVGAGAEAAPGVEG